MFEFTDQVTGEIVQIPLGFLEHHPENPRKNIGDVTELAESIKANGVLQNLTVVPQPFCKKYYVLIGNRRFEAAKLAGLETLPCIIADVPIKEQIQIMLVENMQRNDLTVLEQADAFAQLRFDFGLSVADISKKTGLSKATVQKRIKIGELDTFAIKTQTESRQLSIEELEKLCCIEDESERNKLIPELGTVNFNWKYKDAVTAQNAKRNLPLWKKVLEEKGIRLRKEAKEPTVFSDRYSVYFDKTLPENHSFSGDEEFYDIPTYTKNAIYFYKTDSSEKVTPEQQKQNDEFYAFRRAAEKKLADAFERMFLSRIEFFRNLTASEIDSAFSDIVDFLYMNENAYYVSRNTTFWNLYRLYFLGNSEYTVDACIMHFKNSLKYNDKKLFCFYILAECGEAENLDCYIQTDFYSFNARRLVNIYKFLGIFGYCLSDEEASLLNGTSSLYKSAAELKKDFEDEQLNDDLIDDYDFDENFEEDFDGETDI